MPGCGTSSDPTEAQWTYHLLYGKPSQHGQPLTPALPSCLLAFTGSVLPAN